jgi:uncharacterized protein YdeI (YjbR/CyaY-like superfamily)
LRLPGKCSSLSGVKQRAIAFRSPAAFGAWLDRHHDTAKELWVELDKVSSGAPRLTYKQALDEALRIGWIDGVRKGLDDRRFMVRFAARKPGSKWSAINIRRALELKEAGKMKPPGLAAFDKRTKSAYSFETARRPLDAASDAALRANARAWKFFAAQTPSYRRLTVFWVTSAKKPETRARRLRQVVECSERAEFIPPFRWSNSRPRRPG